MSDWNAINSQVPYQLLGGAGGGGAITGGANLGAGAEVFAQVNGANLEFRTITSADASVVIVQTADEIDLSVDMADFVLDGTNLGAGAEVFAQKNGNSLEFRTLTSTDTSVTLAQTADEIDLSVNTTGFVLDGTNLGAGAEVFAQKNANDLEFRTLTSADASITIVQAADAVDLSVDTSGFVLTASNLGAGAQVFSAKVGNDLQFRTITSADASITLVQTADEIDLSVDTAGFVLDGTNLGAGSQVFAQKNGNNLEFRTLTSADGSLVVVQSATEIDLAVDTSSFVLDGTNLGAGTEVFAQKNGNNLEFRTLTSADASITLVQSATEVDLSVDTSGFVLDGANLGAGAQVFAGKSGSDLQFRSLVSSDGSVGITQNANDIDLTVPNITTISTQEGVAPAGTSNSSGVYAALITLNQVMAAGEVLLLDAYASGLSGLLGASALFIRITVNGTVLCTASDQVATALSQMCASLTARLAVGAGGLIAGANTIILEWHDLGTSISLNPATDGQGARLRLQRMSG